MWQYAFSYTWGMHHRGKRERGPMALGHVILKHENGLPWPATRADILRGSSPLLRSSNAGRNRLVTTRNFNDHFSQVSQRHYLPVELERSMREQELGARANAHGFAYSHHMISRIRARTMCTPKVTFIGWAALRILGLPYWTNDMPVQLVTSAGGRRPKTPHEAHFIQSQQSVEQSLEDADRRRWNAEFHDLPAQTQCISATSALAQALRDVMRGDVRWWLPALGWFKDVVQLSPADIRPVQLLDATRRFLPGDILRLVSNSQLASSSGTPHGRTMELAKGMVNQTRLRRLVQLSNPLTDSPIETLLRLVLRTMIPDLKPQVTLMHKNMSDTPLTTADLWSESARIAIFYDGGHHDSAEQRHIDARIDRDLQSQDIRVLWFTKYDLKNPVVIVNEVMKMTGIKAPVA